MVAASSSTGSRCSAPSAITSQTISRRKCRTATLTACGAGTDDLCRAGEATVDVERLPGDEPGIVAGEKRYRSDQIGNLLVAFDRLHIGHEIEKRGGGHSAGNLAAGKRTRSEERRVGKECRSRW